MSEKRETPVDRYQRRVGLISKSYKLKKDVAEGFKEACEKIGTSQSAELTKFMLNFIEESEEIIAMNGKEALEKAQEMDMYNNSLPKVEVGEIVDLGTVWDGDGEVPESSYSYKIHETDGGVETAIDYRFDIVEEKENPLEIIIKITDICII